jgi:hypothetical protein
VRRAGRTHSLDHGLSHPRVDARGAVLVTMLAEDPGLGALRRFAAATTAFVNRWVNVVADDAAGAAADTSTT